MHAINQWQLMAAGRPQPCQRGGARAGVQAKIRLGSVLDVQGS